MTTHYNIQITASQTELKVTYRNGKLKKIEHLRGKLPQAVLNHIGRAIPAQESDLNTFKTTFKDRVTYEAIIKEKSLYTQFSDAWFVFFSNQNNGRTPKFTSADGNALKQIIKYLVLSNNEDETAALSVWQFILNNWKHLSVFYRENQDLKIINSKLNVIIRELSNKHTSNERTFQSATESEAARTFSFGKSSK